MSEIRFDEATHTYWIGDNKVISVTQLLQKYGLAPSYNNVSTETLNRKAEYGKLVHKELEEYVKSGAMGFTDELKLFIELCKEKHITPLKSEFMVFNGLVAGTVDLLAKVDNDLVLLDYKTTSTLHYETVCWQLSIYAYLYNFMNEKEVNVIKAIHFKDGKAELVDLKLKPKEEIEKLLEAEKNGTDYVPTVQEIVSRETLETLAEIQKMIDFHKKQQEKLNTQAEAIKNQFINLMEQNGIKTLDNEFFRVTYKAPRIDLRLDTKRIQAEQPELCKNYMKETPYKASVVITLK